MSLYRKVFVFHQLSGRGPVRIPGLSLEAVAVVPFHLVRLVFTKDDRRESGFRQ